MAGVTPDTGPLIAAERNDRTCWVWWKWLTSRGDDILTSEPGDLLALAAHTPGVGKIRTLADL